MNTANKLVDVDVTIDTLPTAKFKMNTTNSIILTGMCTITIKIGGDKNPKMHQVKKVQYSIIKYTTQQEAIHKMSRVNNLWAKDSKK